MKKTRLIDKSEIYCINWREAQVLAQHIDGYFDDWRNIEKYQDSDWNEYQEGPEPVDNPSVDLHEYVSINDGFDFFFYFQPKQYVL